MIFVMLISLYTVRLTLKILGVEDYGVYSAIGGVVAALSSLSAVLSGASQRFYAVEIGKGNISRIPIIFYSMIKVYLIVITLLLFVGGPIGYWIVSNYLNYPESRSFSAIVVYFTSLLSLLFTLFASPFQAMIIAKEDMGVYAYVSIIEVLLKLFIVFLLQVLFYDKLILYGLLILTTNIITSGVYIFTTFKKYTEIRVSPKTDKNLYKQIFTFSGWTLFGSAVNMANIHGINLLLNIFFGPIVNAAYAISNQVSYAVNSFATNFFTAVKPGLIKTYSSSDYFKMYNLLEMSSKVSFFLLFMMILPICMETQTILQLWLDKISDYMVIFTVLMLIYMLLLSLNNPITTIFQASGKVKLYHGIVDTFTLLSIPVIVIAFKMGLQPWVSFIINIIIICLAHVIRMHLLYVISGYTKYKYFCRILCPICKLIVISTLLCFILKQCMPTGQLYSIVRLPIDIIIVITIGWTTILTHADRTKLFNIMALKLKRDK